MKSKNDIIKIHHVDGTTLDYRSSAKTLDILLDYMRADVQRLREGEIDEITWAYSFVQKPQLASEAEPFHSLSLDRR